MKRKSVNTSLRVLLILETIVLLIVLVLGFFHHYFYIQEKEVFREKSNDGKHQVIIFEVGEPLSKAHYRVVGPSEFYVDVADNGLGGSFDVEWKEESVVITFRGHEQADAVYELPFKAPTAEDDS